jgi:predicted phosphodiesterase
VRGADLVVHTGDFTGEDLPAELASLARRFIGVRGNSDLPPLRDRLPRREVLALHGRTIGIAHPSFGGAPEDIADTILESEFADQRLDALLFGHTHEGVIERRPWARPVPVDTHPLAAGGGTHTVASGTILLLNPGPGYADFMQPASFARLRVAPEGLEAELVML